MKRTRRNPNERLWNERFRIITNGSDLKSIGTRRRRRHERRRHVATRYEMNFWRRKRRYVDTPGILSTVFPHGIAPHVRKLSRETLTRGIGSGVSFWFWTHCSAWVLYCRVFVSRPKLTDQIFGFRISSKNKSRKRCQDGAVSRTAPSEYWRSYTRSQK